MREKYLPFFWDYHITPAQLRGMLKNKTEETTKIWAMSRLLESAPLKEIWRYISLNELKTDFPKLKLKKPVQKAWQRALKVWSE